MFTKSFWISSLERAVKAFAQTFVAILSVKPTLFEDAPWWTALSTAGLASVLSVMTSVGSVGVGPARDPSVVAHQPALPTPSDAASVPVAMRT